MAYADVRLLKSSRMESPRPPFTSRARGSFPSSSPRQTLSHLNSTSESSTLSSTIMLAPSSTSHIFAKWTSWESLSVTLHGVPVHLNTFTVWKSFKQYGTIDFIELFEDSKGQRDGKGRVRFKPPPLEAFWDRRCILKLADDTEVQITVRLETRRSPDEIPSPVQNGLMYPASIEIPAGLMDVGVLVEERTLVPLKTVGSGRSERIRLSADVARREVNVFFLLTKFEPQMNSALTHGQVHEYRFRIPFARLVRVLQTQNSEGISFVIPLDTPPLYYRKLQDLTPTFTDSESFWRSSDAWFRQTDIVHSQKELILLPISLRKIRPLIDIGRWTTFRITFYKADLVNQKKVATLCNILRDFNVDLQETKDFKIVQEPHSFPNVWQWIDIPSVHMSKAPSSLQDLAGDDYIYLPFVVRYQLEVCLSNGYLNEHTMNREFVTRLASMDERAAKDLLEHVATAKAIYYDPMKIFDIKFAQGATNQRIPKYCCYMRSARVTPTTIYYNTPSVDISNRVIRHYIEYADRFLRVRFTDEKLEGRINSSHNNSMDAVFTRIKRTMANGITIGDRNYEFLAFGNSQFREHGAYFFASLPNLTASNIRAWMGHFNDIRTIAKHAARLGQCFSTTRAVTGCPVEVREIEDIERNGYNFSDGVGRISKFLAQMVKTEFKIRTLSGDPPSVFQFRLGGCKGILTVSAEAQRQEVHIRKSQYKFAAVHNGLEIIRYSQFSMATLNRQLIVVLSSLGIEDEVFKEKLRSMLTNLELAMTSETQAMHLLQKYVDPNQMTLLLADMVHDGFQKSEEPFLTSLLELWRAWQIKYLKEKAKIVIEKGACLLGCVDETTTLKGYVNGRHPEPSATVEQMSGCLPEIFVQVSHADEDGRYEVIEGPCILARNPSLHPGDIRVVNAVNVRELHHLKDVVVLPQTGDRDVPSMCSGGDLDGDDYLVIWDQDLLPKNWFREPMDYSAPKPHQLTRDVTVNDITSFFVTYMKNDRLPQIAHAHLAFADYLEDGVNDERCIRLASLHSAAVDYNKTGIPAKMSKDLVPRKWPHFMEKKYKPKEATYVSRKILGQLYDIVERVDFRPKLEAPFDERILNSPIKVGGDHLKHARDLKNLYDADMRRILAQHEIKTEFEVWSTFVLSHANMSKDYKFHEELGLISSSLRERFRHACYEKAGGKDFESLAPLAVAMYKVTCDQTKAALAKLKRTPYDDTVDLQPGKDTDLPLISFPWVLQSVLGKIANQQFDASDHRIALSVSQIASKEHIQIPKSKQNTESGILPTRDIETAAGIQHSGDILQLFQEEPGLDPFGLLGEAFDRPSHSQIESNGNGADAAAEGTSKHAATNWLIDLNEEDEPPASTLEKSATPLDELLDLIDLSDKAKLPIGPTLSEGPHEWETMSIVLNENMELPLSIDNSTVTKNHDTDPSEPQHDENLCDENKHMLHSPSQVDLIRRQAAGEDDEGEIAEIKRGPTALEQLEKLLGL